MTRFSLRKTFLPNGICSSRFQRGPISAVCHSPPAGDTGPRQWPLFDRRDHQDLTGIPVRYQGGAVWILAWGLSSSSLLSSPPSSSKVSYPSSSSLLIASSLRSWLVASMTAWRCSLDFISSYPFTQSASLLTISLISLESLATIVSLLHLLSNILRNPSNIFWNLSNILRNPSNILQNLSNILWNLSNILRNLSNILQNLSNILWNHSNILWLACKINLTNLVNSF